MADFGTIRPGDIDNFSFDFTNEVGASGTITSAVWTCVVSPDSVFPDTTPQARLIGIPNFDATTTVHQVGTMLDGVNYTLSVVVNVSDGRIFSAAGEVECTDSVAPEIIPGVVPELTVEQFRDDFPAFADASLYPNDSIQYWIDIVLAEDMFPVYRWGAMQTMARELWVAHQVALDAYGMQSGRGGNVAGVGAGIGIPQSKSVNGVSISYDLQMGVEPGMGDYAMTLWGRRLWNMLQMHGMGPVQF